MLEKPLPSYSNIVGYRVLVSWDIMFVVNVKNELYR